MKSSPKTNAFELMHQVEGFCQRHRITPTPLNYVVSYEHLSQSQPSLSQQIELQIEQGHSLNHSFMAQLHHHHLTPDSQQLVKNSGQMQQIIDNLLSSIQDSTSSVDQLTETLDQGMAELAQQPAQHELKNLIAQLLDASLRAQQDQTKLNDKLRQAEADAATLQQQLQLSQQQAVTDPLTGLLNRAGLERNLQSLLQQDPHQICLIALDIDHFKRFNDNYGHLLGDKVLQLVAAQVKAVAREQDLAIRYGGEELLVILPDVALDKAMQMAEEIRTKVQQVKLVNKRTKQTIPSVTLSGGVAQMLVRESWEDWLDRADKALYQSKGSGRNRVIAATT
ncbi:MAG: GGDEF domain-containing protein [Halopseudomonas sp.]